MMEINEIKRFYSEDLWDRQEFLLREYLQYEILKLIFASKHGNAYTFLGGTCLRIVYGTERFSEDLDFDNVGLTQEQFEETAISVQKGLELLGYTTNIKFTYKGAFHCKVTFPSILYNYKLSPHKEARIFIKLDTEKQHFDYEPSLVRIQKLGVDADIFATPLSLLCSQKISAVMGRKRPKGRDFYDLCWILDRELPDYGYLEQKLKVNDENGLRQLVQGQIDNFDFSELADDVSPFLFVQEDIERVRNFPRFWANCRLS